VFEREIAIDLHDGIGQLLSSAPQLIVPTSKTEFRIIDEGHI